MLETERLRLRQWKDEDYPAYARLNADPMVMRYFPSALSVQESHEQADKLRSLITERGWGVWAVEVGRGGGGGGGGGFLMIRRPPRSTL